MIVLLHVLVIAQVAQLLLVPIVCLIIGASPSTGPSNRKK